MVNSMTMLTDVQKQKRRDWLTLLTSAINGIQRFIVGDIIKTELQRLGIKSKRLQYSTSYDLWISICASLFKISFLEQEQFVNEFRGRIDQFHLKVLEFKVIDHCEAFEKVDAILNEYDELVSFFTSTRALQDSCPLVTEPIFEEKMDALNFWFNYHELLRIKREKIIKWIFLTTNKSVTELLVTDEIAEQVLKEDGITGPFEMQFILKIHILVSKYEIDFKLHKSVLLKMNLPDLTCEKNEIVAFPLILLQKMLEIQCRSVSTLLATIPNRDTLVLMNDAFDIIVLVSQFQPHLSRDVILLDTIKMWLQLYFQLFKKTLNCKSFSEKNFIFQEYLKCQRVAVAVGISLNELDSMFYNMCCSFLDLEWKSVESLVKFAKYIQKQSFMVFEIDSIPEADFTEMKLPNSTGIQLFCPNDKNSDYYALRLEPGSLFCDGLSLNLAHLIKSLITATSGNFVLKKACKNNELISKYNLKRFKWNLEAIQAMQQFHDTLVYAATSQLGSITSRDGNGSAYVMCNSARQLIAILKCNCFIKHDSAKLDHLCMQIFTKLTEWLAFNSQVDDILKSLLVLEKLFRDYDILKLSIESYNALLDLVAAKMKIAINQFDIYGVKARMRARQVISEENLAPATSELRLIVPTSSTRPNRPSINRMEAITELENTINQSKQRIKTIGQVLSEECDQHLSSLGSQQPSSDFRWQLGKAVGRGSEGTVYMGINLDTGQPIAIKEFLFTDFKSSENIKKILNEEVATFSLLRHENLVEYYGSQLYRNKLFVFMELCSISLSQFIKKAGKFTNCNLKCATKELLTGLDYLHSHKIIHRDLKPANVLVHDSGHLKITDFTSSKLVQMHEACPSKATLVGTCYYLSPEVVLGKPLLDGSRDIWALGCCVYEMSQGKPPFVKYNNEWAIMYALGSGKEIPIPSELEPAVQDFMKQCFVRDPQERPGTLELLSHEFCKVTSDQVCEFRDFITSYY